MGRIRVLSIKVALATMCSGKLMDKLRCKLIKHIFSIYKVLVINQLTC